MIIIIDYGVGNLKSIQNMLKKVGTEARISSNISDIKKADKLILPGVGAFDSAVRHIEKLGLMPVLTEKVIKNKTPILGICLGMQLFAKKSEEGKLPGFGWLDAETVRFKFDKNTANLKIPHMGWNTIAVRQKDALLGNLPEEPRFYFVHSYHLVCKDKKNVLAQTHFGYDFTSIVRKENIIGVQFHPEKSHKFGMQLLKNFVELD